MRAPYYLLLPASCLREDLLAFVGAQTTECDNFETVFLQQGRGTRGSSTAVSGGEDGTIPRHLLEPVGKLLNRNVEVALDGAALLEFLGAAYVE